MNVSLSREDVVRLTERVEGAQINGYTIPNLTNEYPNMTLSDGYLVQKELRQRLVSSGQRLVGWKAGLTSKAKMIQMGINVPIIGFLTDRMASMESFPISFQKLIHPRIECEIAFVTKKLLKGPSCSAKDVIEATDYILPSLEVIDSRYENFNFDLPSVVADNGSSSYFVTGARARYPSDFDIRSLGVVMEKNGEIVAMGAAASVLDNPANAVAMLVNCLSGLDEFLPAGSIVMSGGITPAIPVRSGDNIVARFQELGTVSLRFVE